MTVSTKTRLLGVFLAASALAALAACGSSGSGDTSTSTSATATPTPTPTPTPMPTPTPTAVNLACQTISNNYPWGKGDLQTWTPSNSVSGAGTANNPGVAQGSAFEARLVQAYGTDTNFSKRTAIFELANGCRRQFQVSSFIDSDVTKIKAAITANPLTDTKTYDLSLAAENQVTQAQVDAGTVGVYTTQHFAFLYGTSTSNFSYADVAAQGIDWATFLQNAGDTMERAWQLDNALLNAPMPYASDASPKKVNVYICGTGLPFIADGDNSDCGAHGAHGVYVSSVYLKSGSTAMVHEFTHTIQTFSGGFQGKDAAGPIWETGANWDSFTQSPTIENGAVFYFDNLENGPLWSHSRYGAYPFFSFLWEKDNTRQFLWSTWTSNLRTSAGVSTEDWMETFVRLAKAAAVYISGYTSLADDMGWYGARLAAMDFFNQKTLLDMQLIPYNTKFYAPLVAGSTTGTYSSLPERPLLQWGTHIVPLTATGDTVSVTLTGATAANSAAWRFTLVSIASDGTPRYANLGAVTGTASATTSITVVSGEKLYLAVTATPGAYQSLGWQQTGAVTGNQFPYTVAITGATPLTSAATACTSVPSGLTGLDLNYNTNGNSLAPVSCPS